MNFFITYDVAWETKIDQVLYTLQEARYDKFFLGRNYGESLIGVNIVLMCRNPLLNFKRRIRYSKKEKEIYIDIMLDYGKLINIGLDEKVRIVKSEIIQDIPRIVARYKFTDFDILKFEIDLKAVFQ